MQKISFYLFLAFEKFLMLFPQKLRESFFLTLAKIAYLFDTKHKKVIKQNLDFLFSDKLTKDERKDIAKSCYKTLALNFLQIVEGKYLTHKELLEDLELVGYEHVKEVLEQNRPIIFATGHYGVWEKAGAWQGITLKEVMTVYKKLNNPYFNEYMITARASWNLSMIANKGALKALLKRLKAGGHVALLIDQNINKKEGVLVDFFGHTIYQTPAPAFLAQRSDAVIIPAYIHYDNNLKHTLTFYKPIYVNKEANKEEEIQRVSNLIAASLEDAIKKHPNMWFWCHRRFKESHPHIYS